MNLVGKWSWAIAYLNCRRSHYLHLKNQRVHFQFALFETKYSLKRSKTREQKHTAKPVWFNADIRFLAFEMIGRASGVLRTSFVCFIGCCIVFAIVNTITNLWLRNTSAIETREFTVNAWWICAAFFVWSVFTIIFMVLEENRIINTLHFGVQFS